MMNKEEQIALELTKLSNPKDDDSVWADYTWFLNKLCELKGKENDINILNDELGTYRYILQSICDLLKRDGNNFILKEDLKGIIGDLYVKD